MKKLILYDHLGNKLLELDAFVEGQDFYWQSPKPVAFWLGWIRLVDEEPEPEPKVEVVTASVVEIEIPEEKEEKVESAEVDNQSTRDKGVGEASELESVERLPEQPAGEQPSQRSKKPRKRKAT